jgi:hypothetical protein
MPFLSPNFNRYNLFRISESTTLSGSFVFCRTIFHLPVEGVSKVFALPPVETGGYSWATLTALYMYGLIECSLRTELGTATRAECRIINANRIYSTL